MANQNLFKRMALRLAAFLCFSTVLAVPIAGVSFSLALLTGNSQAFTSSLGTLAAKYVVHYSILVVGGIVVELGVLAFRLESIELGESIDGCEDRLVVKLYMRLALTVLGRTGSRADESTSQ